MKQEVEIGSGVVIYIPSFINTGSAIRKVTGRIHRHTGTDGIMIV
jgi:hypothetical protein